MSDEELNKVVGIIKHFFEEQRIRYVLLVCSDRYVYRCGFSSHSLNYPNLQLDLVVDSSSMQSYVSLPGKFEDAEDVIIKYVSRINPEFKLGRFEYNFRNGRVAFHLGQRVDIVKDGMPPQILMDQVYYPLTVMDRFADGFYDLVHGAASPKDAAVKYLNANRTTDAEKREAG